MGIVLTGQADTRNFSPSFESRSFPGRKGFIMRYTLSIALGLAVLALTALVITLAVNQQHLREARTELAKANEQLVQNRDAADQLEQTISNLKAELDARNKAGTELKENLDESTSNAEKLR